MIINSNRCFGLAVGLCVLFSAATAATAQDRACFVPHLPEGCDPQVMVLTTIDGAQKSVLVLMYELTAREITTALVNAKRRGVDVRAIVDKRQDHTYEIDRLLTSGVSVLVDTVRGLMHNKVMIVDGATVVTGSFNYTSSAEHKNAENLLLIHDPALVAEYMQYWKVREEQSHPLSVEPLRRRTDSDGEVPDGVVRGNRHSMIYQWPGCSYYDTISERNRVEFPSAKAAEEAGYRPAKSCR
jgi:phosphatidylserine/phosphatidylglycerophosphate/cardiolipin synthase-like enzyme